MIVVGLRMGLLALNVLGAKGWFDLHCRVFARRVHPDSCTIDGIQTATGCTMGKQNIEVEEGEGVAAEFTTDGGCLRLRLKPSLLERIHESLEDEELSISLNQELIDARDEDIFEINYVRKDVT